MSFTRLWTATIDRELENFFQVTHERRSISQEKFALILSHVLHHTHSGMWFNFNLHSFIVCRYLCVAKHIFHQKTKKSEIFLINLHIVDRGQHTSLNFCDLLHSSYLTQLDIPWSDYGKGYKQCNLKVTAVQSIFYVWCMEN
jgi:hypothetical protein